jgi:hypothetical protein
VGYWDRQIQPSELALSCRYAYQTIMENAVILASREWNEMKERMNELW